jgi:hypothetical protein
MQQTTKIWSSWCTPVACTFFEPQRPEDAKGYKEERKKKIYMALMLQNITGKKIVLLHAEQMF